MPPHQQRVLVEMMPPYQQRVLVEREELAEKTKKLTAFLSGDIIGSVPPKERARLHRQYSLMVKYREVLDERIAAFA